MGLSMLRPPKYISAAKAESDKAFRLCRLDAPGTWP